MKKKHKLCTLLEFRGSDLSVKTVKAVESKIKGIDNDICKSHIKERECNEARAVTRVKEDPKYFFRYAKKFKRTSENIGPLLNGDGQLTNDMQEISHILSNQFCSTFSTPRLEEVICDPITFFDTDKDFGSSKLSNVKIGEPEVLLAINEMPSHAAAGPDGVPSQLLKQCSSSIVKPLCILFNKSMNEGTIPALLKKATIVPIYKGGNNSAACNYRPVSLTSNIMKIFERVIRKQLVDYMTENDLLNHTQHGFRHGRSCLSALLSVYDDLVNMNITASAVHMIYLDFSKAFDKVDHGILEHKLSQIGVCGKLSVWIHNFLQERSQYVRVPGGISDEQTVISGVPQGTVLGPVLFLILMSDIDKDISESKVVSFADDTRIYHQIDSDDSTNQLQTDLNKMYNWSVTNNMLFNASKFQSICYSSHASVDSNFIYKDHEDNPIAWFDHVKDLGIYMSQNLTFVEQINTVYIKCSQLMGWILRTFISRERTVMLLLFKSLVLSRVDNGSQLWSPHQKQHICLIEKIQRSFTKHIDGMKDFISREIMCSEVVFITET